MDGFQILNFLIAVPIIGIILFILARKLWLWYWKIEEVLDYMHDLKWYLQSIDKKLDAITNQKKDADLTSLN